MTNSHSSLSDPFSPSLSVLPSSPFFSVKLLTSNPITLQFDFSMPQFSLENVGKCWVAYSFVGCLKSICALPLEESFVSDTHNE